MKYIPAGYFPEYGCSRFNQWMFMNECPNTEVSASVLIATRSSGPADYHVHWRYYPQDSLFKLVLWAYHEDPTACAPTVIATAQSMREVIEYCATHIHPDLSNL